MRNFYKKFSAHFISDSLRRAILYKNPGGQYSERREKVGNNGVTLTSIELCTQNVGLTKKGALGSS